MGLIWLLVVGLIAGFLARALVPGKDPMGILGTLVLGVVGSYVGGFLGSLIGDGSVTEMEPAGWFGSIIGAIVALLIWRQIKKRA